MVDYAIIYNPMANNAKVIEEIGFLKKNYGINAVYFRIWNFA